MNRESLEKIAKFQVNEITEFEVYGKLAQIAKNRKNKEVLEKISHDELRHYKFWKKFTGKDYGPDRRKVSLYINLAKIFGLSFAVKLMEMGEEKAQIAYADFAKLVPEINNMIKDEDQHELETLNILHDQYLKNAGSIVLGLNDALIELTGALAGLTLALQDSKLIALSGIVTGVAAAFSMGASEYLSKKAEEKSKNESIRSALYTFVTYFFVVILLILPFFLLNNIAFSIACTFVITLSIIALYSFYVSVVQQVSFKKQFYEMTLLSLGVSLLTFAIGLILRNVMDIQI